MRKLFTLSVLLMLHGILTAQLPTMSWAKGLLGNNNIQPSSIAVDPIGNVYSCGWFTGTVDMDPGASTSTLASLTYYDAYISKLDNAGNYIWAKQIDYLNSEIAEAITTDASGNVYIAGKTGANILTCKFDASGTMLWSKNFVGDVNNNTAYAIKVDPAGNVYTTGLFKDTVDFDPGPGTVTLTTPNTGTPVPGHVYISKQDPSGNLIWVKDIGGLSPNDNGTGTGLALDKQNNIYIGGNFSNYIDLDPGAGTFSLNSTVTNDAFVAKYDSMGNFIWGAQFSGPMNKSINGLCLDSAGNVCTAGTFDNTVDFDPGPGVYNVSGSFDNFICKLNPSGNLVWVKNFGGTATDACVSITSDPAGNVYTTGLFFNTVDFDPGAGTFNMTSAGNTDIFIQKLDFAGNFKWAVQFSGSGNDRSKSLTADASGHIYSTGYISFGTSCDFDPGPGTFIITGTGNADTYVHKLAPALLGLDETKSEAGITLFPNPSNGTFYIRTEKTIENGELVLINILGQNIFTGKVDAFENKFQTEHLAKGIYCYKIYQNKTLTHTGKLVIE